MMSFCGRIVFFLCLLYGDDTYYKCLRHMCGSLIIIIIIPTSSLEIVYTMLLVLRIIYERHLSSCTFCSKTRATNNNCCVLYPRQHHYHSLSLSLTYISLYVSICLVLSLSTSLSPCQSFSRHVATYI